MEVLYRSLRRWLTKSTGLSTCLLLTAFTTVFPTSLHAEDPVFDPSAKPEFDLTFWGSTTASDLLVEGKNPLLKESESSGWIKLRGRNRTQNVAGIYLSSLEGMFEGEFVAKVDRSDMVNLQSGAGVMARYALGDNADFASLVFQKNGSVIFRKRMGDELTEETVAAVRENVSTIWLRLRVEENNATFALAKDLPNNGVPTQWMEVGERTAFSDFMYLGVCLLPAKGTNTLESVKFPQIAYQAIGGENSPSGTGSRVAARSIWGRIVRRVGNLVGGVGGAIVVATYNSVSDAWDWTVDNVGDAGGVAYRVVIKRTVIPLWNYVVENTAGEIMRVVRRGFAFGADKLPPYESIDEGYHAAKVLDDMLANDADRTRSGDPKRDPFYIELTENLKALDAAASKLQNVEKPVDARLGEWDRLNNSVYNLKLYMADAISVKMGWKNTGRRFSPEKYQLYTGFILEKGLTRTRKMLKFCFDAKTPDIFDILVVPAANDIYDCVQATSKFNNTAFDIMQKYADKDLISQRDEAIQTSAEYLSLLGMMANIDSDFEWRWRPQRNDLYGKVKWYIDGVGGPAYGNSNIPVKVYAGLAMNRISRGANDPTFQKFNSMITDLTSSDGGFAEGTDYLDWTLQEAIPVYSWGIANGWIKPKDVPAKVRSSAEWLVRSADGGGYIPRVDDASSININSGLNFWLAPFSLINSDGRFMDYAATMQHRFPKTMIGKRDADNPENNDPKIVSKFLTYPIRTQGPEKWNPVVGAHYQGGIGAINFENGNSWIGSTLLAEDGFLLEKGGSHDQQDNSSFTLNRWDSKSQSIDRLVVDPGYPGFADRATGLEARYLYHNTPFIYRQFTDHHLMDVGYGGVSSNGRLSTQAMWERSIEIMPYLDDYMCATSLWNTVTLATGTWILGQVVQGMITPSPLTGWTNLLTLPFISVPFACGQFDLPNIKDMEGRAGGGSARFQEKYSNGLMSLQSYDVVGGSSSRAVIHEGKDVLVLDFFYRDGQPAGRMYGVSYNLPGGDQQVTIANNNAWNLNTGTSSGQLQFFPGVVLHTAVPENGRRNYLAKDDATFRVFRVSQAYQPSGNKYVFPHLSSFQVGADADIFSSYVASNACLGTEICVERTEGTQSRLLFVRTGFPSQAGQVVVALKNGQTFTSDAGFGILDIEQTTGKATVTHLYHVSSASLAGQSLLSGNVLKEWPKPAIPRVAELKIGNNVGAFPNRTLFADVTEITQGEYEAGTGSNPADRPGEDLPVTGLTWFDAIAYANMRSQTDGLVPCYQWTTNIKDANGHITNLEGLTWDKRASGYRLPTLDEWQGLAGSMPTSIDDKTWLDENAGSWLKGASLGTADRRGMHGLWGNAAEWTWAEGSQALVTGGSVATELTNLTASQTFAKSSVDPYIGFRLVRSEAEEPAFFQFEDPLRAWTQSGVALPTAVGAGGNRGQVLQISGGYQKLDAPIFRASELTMVGDKLLLDVYLPKVPVNPWWLGDVQVFVNAPSQSVNARILGNVSLTGKALGDWNTLEFQVDAATLHLLKGDVRDLQFQIVVNSSAGNVIQLDNLRFGGTLLPRSLPAANASQMRQDDLNILGFETNSGWISSASLGLNQAAHTQGGASLQVVGNGWITITSVPLASNVLISSNTTSLVLDLYVPNPQPNPWWTGSVQLTLESTSANLHGIILGTVDLTPLAKGQFHKLSFSLPAAMQNTLAAGIPDLKLGINLNTSSQAGPFLFDHLRGE